VETERCRLSRRPSTRATVDGEVLEPAVRLASNSPPVHKPAGYFNRSVVRGSELGRQVAVDFESDADFHKCGSCPVHSLLAPFHYKPAT
jgi:hypothetical protein